MDQKIISRLLKISCFALAIAGCLFLGLSIFGNREGNTDLTLALGCIVLSNLFMVVDKQLGKKK